MQGFPSFFILHNQASNFPGSGAGDPSGIALHLASLLNLYFSDGCIYSSSSKCVLQELVENVTRHP